VKNDITNLDAWLAYQLGTTGTKLGIDNLKERANSEHQDMQSEKRKDNIQPYLSTHSHKL
jgi:hypothetical protein